MAPKKIITVFGATGNQGGSVVDIFLNDPKLKDDWTVRAVTRDTTKESAKKLERAGAETVAANLDDKSSLVNAMNGAYAVYAVTNYWEKLDAELEIKQGKALVDAAKETGVQHFIWSSLLNITKLSNGKLPNVYHFDSKATIADYAREVGIPATFFMPGMYMASIAGLFRQVGDAWTLALPIPATAPTPVFDTADTGKFIKAAVLHRDKLLGKHLLGATAYLTGAELVGEFKKVFPEAGTTAGFHQASVEEYKAGLKGAGFPDFVVQEILENMLLLDQFGYFGGEGLEETHSFVEDALTTWEEHVRGSKVWAGLK